METLSITIHKDIRDFKPKLVGQFTGRQLICVVIVGIIFLAWKSLLKNILGFENISYLPAIIPAIIPAAFGWGDMVFGMPVEVYFRLVFVNEFVAIKRRKFRTHNYISIEYDKLWEEKKKAEADNQPKSKKKPAKLVGEEFESFD